MFTEAQIQQLRKVIREEVKTEVNSALEISLNPIKKDIKIIKKDGRYLKKTVGLVVKNYDEGDNILGKRVSRIETHLHLSPLTQN